MIGFFVKRPLFTISIFTIVLLVGLFSLSRLPQDFLPNIEIPTLTILTPYPGASASDIETTVSKVIEDGVATVPNIDKITSNSQENLSQVTISFKWGADLNAASADVRDKMDAIRAKLPNDIEPSTILKFDTSMIPILVLGITADESYPALYQLADKKISLELKRIAGVGAVTITGGLIRQINVDVSKERLEAYHLSMNQLNAALQRANLSLPAGSLKSGQLEYGIRVPGEYASVAEIGQTIVGNYQNRAIFLADVAKVTDSFKEQTNMTEVNGRPGVQLTIQKQSGANAVAVIKTVRARLAALENELPADVKITVVQDTGESITRQIDELVQTLAWAFLFVALTVLFFLRNIRGALIVSLAIPFSLIAAFVYLYLAGASINIISLASIIVAIGVVVDDAIVVMENIYRHRDQKNEGSGDAAINGASEVFGAVLASTTTSMVIFLPLLIVGGFIGIFFQQLSLITIVVIGMSLFVAIALTPMLCSKILQVRKKGAGGNAFFENLFDRSEQMFEAVESAYKRALAWSLSRRRLVIGVCAAVFIASLFLFQFIGSEFFPVTDDGYITGSVTLPAGTRWEETAAIMRTIEKKIMEEVPELEYVLVTGGSSSTISFGAKNGANYGNIYLKVVPLAKRKRGIQEIQRVVDRIALSLPGVKSIDFGTRGANSLMGSDKPVTVEIYGSDFDLLDTLAAQLEAKIAKVPGVVDPIISREKSNPEYAFTVDRAKAANFGLTVADVALAARNSLYGTIVSRYREGGDEYDIFTRFQEKDRSSLEQIKGALVPTSLGTNVALGNVANVELRGGPQMIQRKNQQRLVTVQADYFGRALGDIIADVQKIIDRTALPNDTNIIMGGSAESIAESFAGLFLALGLGLCLLYLVMVAQFESFRDPFVVMFAIPFAIVGVAWALFLTGTPFGVISFVGLIMVAGVAVKNSIILVDYTNTLRAQGLALKEAIEEAGKTRLRPILMTSATTILGLLPIVLNSGESAAFWKPMGIAVIGGLLVSATISLLFVPTVYFVLESRREGK